MFSADSIVFADTLEYKTLLNGRIVHSGGGIMPDIFMPLDTSSHYGYINRLRRNNVVYNFALEYIDKNRNVLKSKYPDFKDFEAKYETSDAMIAEIVEMGVKDSIEKNEESLLFGVNDLKKEIKAIIARDIYSRDDFYKIYYKDDEAIIEALKVIANQKEYNKLLVSTQH